MRFLKAMYFFTLLASFAMAQEVPHFIRFSGQINGSSGTVGVTFTLHRSQEDGASLWMETQNVTLDAAGRYTVLLGATKADGLPTELFTSGEAQWLGVQVEGQKEQPRILLVSVPYAMKAAEAETLSGKPLSAFVLAGPDAKKSGDGLTYLNSSANAAVTPYATAGSTNYLPKFVNATDLGNSAMYQSGTKIGINTTAPLASLHVVSPAGSASGGYFDVYSGASTTAPFVPMFQRSARGTSAAPSATQANDYLGGFGGAGYTGAAFTNNRAGMFARAAENWTATATGAYLQFITTPAGATAPKEVMRITPDSKVGILTGTTAPAATLEVNGTAKFDGLVTFPAAQTFPGTQNRVTGTCGPGLYVQGVNADGTVACGLDLSNPGTVTAVSSGLGSGLTVTNPTTTPQITTDFSVIQARLTAACSAGLVLQGINADGTPSCVSSLSLVPTGFSILGQSPTPPAGYTLNGWVSAGPQGPWSVGPALSTARYQFGSATVGAQIFALDGSSTVALNSVEMLDPTVVPATWVTQNPSPALTARFGLAAASSSNGVIYLFGGDNHGVLPTAELYAPSFQAVITLASMPQGVNEPCVVADSSRQLYIIGGYYYDVSNAAVVNPTVYKYDTTSDTYSSVTSLPTPVYAQAA